MKNLILIVLLPSLLFLATCKKDKARTYPTVGLVSHIDFDDNFKDLNGYSGDGVKTGSPLFVNGKLGKAISFTSANQYITFSPKVPKSSTSISIAFWVKSTDPVEKYFFYYATNANSWAFAGDLGNFLFRIVTPSDVQVSGVGVGSEWNHVVGTYDGTSIKIYVNGVLKGSAQQAEPIDGFNSDIVLGNYIAQSDWLGTIDELLIYNQALSAQEVQQLYQYYL